MNDRLHQVQLFLSKESQCSYLPDRRSRSVVVDPELSLDSHLYGQLLALGFRRSGNYVYAPHCPACSACTPARVPVNRFQANRSQRRTLRKNGDLAVVRGVTEFTDEHYQLYKRYLSSRHRGGEMEKASKADSEAFLLTSWSNVELIEFRLNHQLVAVAVTDQLPDSLSSVYTFYTPELDNRALGVYAILQQIEAARDDQRQWLYLGYYIAECRKMAYKVDYRPIELRSNNAWHLLHKNMDPGSLLEAPE